MANLLWSTVAMIPQVNEMIWTRAQRMAMVQEARCVCAQTRIGANFRMFQCKRIYHKKRVSAISIENFARCVLMRQRISKILLLSRYDRIFRIRHLHAIVCQKYWRGYKRRSQFQIYKRNRQLMLQEARANRRKKLQQKFRQCMQGVIFRKVQKIQSIIVVVWILLLRDRRHVDQNVGVEIQVFVPFPRITKYFRLQENEIAKCLDKFILQRGPLSVGEMLNPFFLSHLTSRLWFQVIDDQLLTVNFDTSGVIEKGDLVHSCLVEFHAVKYVLSMYRSPSNTVIRLYNSEGPYNLRVEIPLNLLAAWISIYKEKSVRGEVGALKAWELYQMFKNYDADEEIEEGTQKCGASEELLSQDSVSLDLTEISGLIPWIMDRIDVHHDPVSKKGSIVLQFETDAKRFEQMAIVLQRVWRGKRARMMAKEEIFRQYEKCFDMTLRAFFYVNIHTSQKQWSKPRLLSENDDIDDPPDEWRAAEYFDQETKTSKNYYFNPRTGQSSWITEEDAARILQRKFRARITQDLIMSNLNFSQIVHAVKYTEEIERKYKQNPLKLSSRVNLALLYHCLKFDLPSAKSLYEDAISHSSCHPVISRAYGIFILATACETEMINNFKTACKLFDDAEVLDPGAIKFRSAIENFFYWSIIMHPNNPIALLNYALLHQCILGEYYRAEKIYRRALSVDSKNSNVSNNYNFFIDQLYPGGFYAGNGVPNVVIRRSQIKETRPDWGEWRLMFDPLCTNSYDSFWYNSIDFVSSFDEPNWKNVWATRVRRSSIVPTDPDSLWVEYFDPKLRSSFLYNRTTDEYAWKRSATTPTKCI
jgi:Splicing factor